MDFKYILTDKEIYILSFSAIQIMVEKRMLEKKHDILEIN